MRARVPDRDRGVGPFLLEAVPATGLALRLLILLILLALSAAAARAVQAQTPMWFGAGAGPDVSVIEIPLVMDLQPLFLEAEALLPREVGSWDEWRSRHGVELRYRAWRGPLQMTLSGDLLQVQAHVRYWIRGRRSLLGGFSLGVDCGVDEPPRQAVVGLQVRLGWGADWSLRPGFRVLPTRFIDGCEVTAADIDISPVLDRLFRRHMEESLREALSGFGPRLAEARVQAARYWEALQQPVDLGSGLWLRTEPLAVALAPPLGRGNQLATSLGLVALFSLVTEPAATEPPRSLPPLQTFYPRGAGMRFDLAVDVDLEELGSHLSGLLSAESVEVEGRQVRILDVALRGDGGELVLDAALGGEAAGRIEIRALPVYDPAAQKLALRNLDFVFDPRDPDQALMVDLFYQRIQSALQDGANALLDEQTDGIRAGLASALSRALPGGLGIDISSLRLQNLRLTLGEAAIRLDGAAQGVVAIKGR